MIKCSEFVTIGHPDKTADYISSYVLDRFLEQDANARYALEVQIKDNFVTISGEVTSKANISKEDIQKYVKEAVDDIGYTKTYQDKWGKENTICSDDIEVTQHISVQSPNIANGVNNQGWGDQGIFWGMAVNNKNHMPEDYTLAKTIANIVVKQPVSGLDIKTQVFMKNEAATECIVAVPLMNDTDVAVIRDTVKSLIHNECNLIINGTGIYQIHGSIGDCGTTGRKLAVDFYGGNCKIGGGSPWTKDASKADLTLNIYARHKAVEFIKANGIDIVYCGISCCIGKKNINVWFLDKNNNLLEQYVENRNPEEIIELFGLRKPIFAELCRNGLFSKWS